MTSTEKKATKKTVPPVTAKNGHAADVKPKADKVKYEPFLNGTQESIADIIGDLLIAGGTSGDVETLVDIALDHQVRRYYASYNYTPEELQKLMAIWVNNRRQKMIDDLAVARANRPALPEEDRPEPKTVSDRIRAASRESLKRKLATFMGRASAEEIRLMDDVLTNWDPEAFPLNPFGEVPLAEAFAEELGGRATYLRVPNRLAIDVQSYLTTLMKISKFAGAEESES